MGAYAQTPESYYNQTKLYDNHKSNSQIAISVDKSTYSVRDTINVVGYVSNYKAGSAVTIDILAPSKKSIEHVTVTAAQAGNFNIVINLPEGTVSGTYTMIAYYGVSGTKVSLPFTVIGNEKPSSIIIPNGANVAFNKLNFIPAIFRVKTGVPITWLNSDQVVHSISSGTVGAQNRIFTDGKFDTGVISPGQTATISLPVPGNYTYFDPAYPWLVGKLIVTGSAIQNPNPIQNNTLSDDDVTLTTQRVDLEPRETTLFNDNMTSALTIYKGSKSDNFTISNDKDAKVGINSIMINVGLKNGTATLYHDYTVKKLQDWSHYNYLNFWFKGQNTKKTIIISLRDASWKSRGNYYDLVDNSTDWKKVQIPLYTAYYNMSMSNIQGLVFSFAKGTQGQFKIDDIQLISEGKKTLFNDNIASVVNTWSQPNSSATITISDTNDAKVGTNSLGIQVETKDGSASVFYYYTAKKLQDWSNYNYLNFWFKGQNTQKPLQVNLRGATWNAIGHYNFVDDSTDWKKVQIPLYPTYKNMDITKVLELEIVFSGGTKGEFFVDDMALSIKAIEPTIETSKDTYISGETIFVSGNVKVREANTAVSAQVLSPHQNIATVNQIVPKADNTFNFTLHVSGSQFNDAGVYKIVAQYGLLEHKANTSFTVLNPQLAETYKDFGIYNVNNAFYAILQTQGGFDINRILAGQYSTIFTNSTLDNIKKTIDENTTPVITRPPPAVTPKPVVSPPKPVPPFPIPNWVLLSIWESRKDLQDAYPEVNQGNMTNLKIWAKNVGWNQEPRLAALIPEGEIPEYLIQNETSTTAKPFEFNDLIPTLQIVVAIIAIAIGGVFGYKFYRSKKKLPTGTP